jgi:hypothetical protein
VNLTSVKKLLTGLSVSQEYVCLGMESFSQVLKVFLSTDEGSVIDVTTTHILLGYKPLIIGIALRPKNDHFTVMETKDSFSLNFISKELSLNCRWKGIACDKKALGIILVRKIKKLEIDDLSIFLLEGVNARHRFIPPVNQYFNTLWEKFKTRKSGNIDLEKKLYEQVRIAYSIPRKISLITVGDENRVNVFPTDLHGLLNDQYYVSSLRIGGQATRQVEQFQELILSDIDVSFYKETYLLGKNHIAELLPTARFSAILQQVPPYTIPIPNAAIRFIVLKQIHCFDYGIHRIHFYKILYKATLKEGTTLAHIHHYYAQWRINKKITSIFLFR